MIDASAPPGLESLSVYASRPREISAVRCLAGLECWPGFVLRCCKAIIPVTYNAGRSLFGHSQTHAVLASNVEALPAHLHRE